MSLPPELLDFCVCKGPGDTISEQQLADAGVKRAVIHGDAALDTKNALAVTSLCKVRLKWKFDDEECWKQDEFVVYDGTVPSGVELAIMNLHEGESVAFNACGEAALTDFEPLPKADISQVFRSGQAEVLDVKLERKDKFDMSASDKIAFGEKMNEIGKKLFANGRLARAAEVWKRAAEVFAVLEPEDEDVNPNGMKNNEACHEVARKVYLNMALVMYKLENFTECELYCCDVLDTRVDEPTYSQIKSKALFRRGCARLKLRKVSLGSRITADTAEADFFLASELDSSIDVAAHFDACTELREQLLASGVEIPSDDVETPNVEDEMNHYPTDIEHALRQIRRENLHDGLAFEHPQKRAAILEERMRVYRRLMDETPWSALRGTMFDADSEELQKTATTAREVDT